MSTTADGPWQMSTMADGPWQMSTTAGRTSADKHDGREMSRTADGPWQMSTTADAGRQGARRQMTTAGRKPHGSWAQAARRLDAGRQGDDEEAGRRPLRVASSQDRTAAP